MVRLKEEIGGITFYRIDKFQFQYGAIKGKLFANILKNNSYFNSSMVRLKAF